MEKTAGSSGALLAPTVGEEVERIASEATELAEAYVIDSPEVAEAAGEDLKRLTAEYKRVEEMRFAITRPLDEAKKQAMSAFKPYLDKIEAATSTLRQSLNRWLLAERKRVEEEDAKRRQAEAEAAAKVRAEAEAAERLFDKAIESNDAQLAEQAVAQAEAAQAEAEVLAVATSAPVERAQKLGGISQSSTWRTKDVNLHELVKAAASNPDLLDYLTFDKVKINKVVKALGARHNIPGVTAEEVFGLSVRS